MLYTLLDSISFFIVSYKLCSSSEAKAASKFPWQAEFSAIRLKPREIAETLNERKSEELRL
jgi:hypothetical protein